MKRTLSEEAWLASIGKHRGVAIRILDIIEEMLASKEIMIPDEDRTGEESEACLYGMTYAALEDDICLLYTSWSCCSVHRAKASKLRPYWFA